MGISYRRIATDALSNLKPKRGQYRFSNAEVNPIPCGRPETAIDPNYKYRPGTGCPDPIPARPAGSTDEIQSFKGLHWQDETSGSYAGPDPVPATNMNPE